MTLTYVLHCDAQPDRWSTCAASQPVTLNPDGTPILPPGWTITAGQHRCRSHSR